MKPLNAILRGGAVLLGLCLLAGYSRAAVFTNGIVASTHPLATDAGLAILESGGNAIDAAITVGLTLGVVDGHNSGIGGGCFMLIRLADGRFVAIDGREKAPAAATRDMFIRDGKADPALSQTGALASGVPGEVAAFEFASRNFGKKSFADLCAPGAAIAKRGFKISESYAARLKGVANDLGKFEASRQIFFRDGNPLAAGAVLKQTDLAKTYEALGKQGGDWFYHGPFAQAAAAWMKTNGGIMTARDFADYRVSIRQPVSARYRGYEVVTFPPPSSGGVHLLEMLNTLGQFDLKKMDEAARLHVIAEAMKLAFADRAYWLGDPDFVKVPHNLVAPEYGAELARKINVEHAMPLPEHGTPPDAADAVFSDKHTTHFSVADRAGNWVACTCTVNTGFGSKVVVPGTGVVLNDQMDDFSAQAGVPNYFGLVGSEANAVAPGKRPLSSMTPAIVLKDGQPVIAIGAAGGPKIITCVLLELVSLLDLDRTLTEALSAPRIHQQWSPDELYVESGVADDVKKNLKARGQKVVEVKGGAVSHAVARSADGKSFVGAADPRSGGTAAGW
jgi:gamma-glutamyltranspeptidase/glutathione hydrolase